MNRDFLKQVETSFLRNNAITLGAPILEGHVHPQPLVTMPLAMLNRHGLIAGATGTGKTRTLQLVAEQLSLAGVPTFVADVKGDLSGLAVAGTTSARIEERAKATGHEWQAREFPVEFLSLTGDLGARLRASIASFGPMLLSRVLGLNSTQTSVLSMVFSYCDDEGLALVDLADLRAVLQYLADEGAEELRDYGGMSRQTVGVLLRELIELEQRGMADFFGEPEFDLADLIGHDTEGRGVISLLELADCRDRPELFSTFMLWMLTRLYIDLPEVGDLDKPKLVFFLDEAHLLFDGTSKAFREQVEQIVRLIRSKGVGIIFITQSPRDLPSDVLGQLGNRIQHALRAFTPDDAKALRAAARTFPRTDWYDIEELLTTVGTGEALVTVLTEKGTPTPPVAVHLIAPAASMSQLPAEEHRRHLSRSAQVARYATTVDPESAREMLEARLAAMAPPTPLGVEDKQRARPRVARPQPTILDRTLRSPLARSATNQIIRTVLGVVLGRRRR